MSYLLRGALVSTGLFFGIYVALSVAVGAAWRAFRRRCARWTSGPLYMLRILPGAAALGFTALLVVPSFLYLEPRGTGEAVGPAGIALAAGGFAIIVAGAISAFVAWRKTNRFIASCSVQRRVEVAGASAVEMNTAVPLLLVAGIRRPTLLISAQAGAVLDEREMRVAVRHELAHAASWDNLKKLGLRACAFPGMKSLERRWMQAAEVAADDAAVTDEAAALDLASALVKMARQPSASIPAAAMSLVPERGEALHARVERLLAWKPARRSRLCWTSASPAVATLAALVFAAYPTLLANVHEITEIFVR